MSTHKRAEELFYKAVTKHNQLIEYEKSATPSQLIIFLESLISDYTDILTLLPKDKDILNNRGLAINNLAELYLHIGKDKEAMEEFDSAIVDFSMVLAYDNSYLMSYSNRAVANYNISKIYTKMDKKILAIQYLHYANDDYTSILKLDSTIEGIINQKASITFDLGEAYAFEDNIGKSLNYFEESIYYYQKILNSISDEVDTQALNNIALAKFEMAEIYAKEGDDTEAIKLYEESNYYYTKILDYNSSDINAINNISLNTNTLANIYEKLGSYKKAIGLFQNSIDYSKRVLNIELENRNALNNLVISKSDMAMVYTLIGQEREAIELYLESIDDASYMIDLDPNDIKSINNIAISNTELARIYRYKATKEQDETIMKRAMSYYENSSRYYLDAIEIDNKDSINYINQSLNYSEIGISYIYLKNNKKAIEFFKKSLDTLYYVKEINGDSRKISHKIAQREFELAQIYKIDGDQDSYFDFLHHSLETINFNTSELNIINDRASIKSEMGLLYLNKNQKDIAEKFFNSALKDYYIALELNPNNIMVLDNMATVLEFILSISIDSYYFQKAIWVNRRLLELYDNYYIDIGAEDDSFSMTYKMTKPLNHLLDIYACTTIDKESIKELELVKSKKLKQLLLLDYIYTEESQEIKLKLDDIKEEMKGIDSLFDRERQNQLYSKFNDYSQQLSSLIKIKNGNKEVEFDKILDNKSVVIYPIYDNKKLTIITATGTKETLSVQISQIDIRSNIKFSDYILFIKYIESLFSATIDIQKRSFEKIKNITIDDEIKNQIFKKDGDRFISLKIGEEEFFTKYKYKILEIALSHIAKPIVNSIPKGVKKIYFSPFGDLNLLPLHAISTGDNNYLIERYEIAYIPFLSILDKLKPIDNIKKDLVISVDTKELADENNLHNEAISCAKILDIEPHQNIDTVEFKNMVDNQKYNILHLSTHGLSDLGNPLNSYLLFKNSRLSLLEIHGLKLNINLVVLSACETNLSILKGADEILAFERAFLIAGAKNIITTFSTVNIIRTRDFMEEFYTNMEDKKSISYTFQQTCIEDIRAKSREWMLFRFMGN